MYCLPRGWLEHHLTFCADGEAEVAAGFGETVYLGLHFLLLTGIEGAFICKEEVPEYRLLYLCNSLQSHRT